MGLMAKLIGTRTEQRNDRQKTNGNGATQFGLKPFGFGTVETRQRDESPRYYTASEANELKRTADQKTAEATATKSAYRSLARIKRADASVHLSHRKYARNWLDDQKEQDTADAKLAKKMLTLTPAYSRLAGAVQMAGQKAQLQIQHDNQVRQGRFEQFRSRLQEVR